MKLLILSAQDVVDALPMAEAIEGMKTAFAQLSIGKTTVPLRSYMDVPTYQGVSLVMPAYLHETGDMAVKLVSVFADNPKHGLPVINGVVLVLDVMTGLPLAMMNGAALTAIRTGAASGAACCGAATGVRISPAAAGADVITSAAWASSRFAAAARAIAC